MNCLAVQCTSSLDSKCSSCETGFYLNADHDACRKCTEVINKCETYIACGSESDTKCEKCLIGYTADINCSPCFPINNCPQDKLTCTNYSDSVCSI